jgi:signal transduction histidine kinase
MLANWDIVRYAATQLREVAADKADLLPLIDSIVDAERIGISAGQRINGIVSSLRNFARLDQAIEDETDIHELIESTLPLVAHLMKNRIEVRREYAKIPRVRCYPAKLNQVWMNLIVNAAQAIEGRGEIRIQTYTRNSHAVVAISDSGAGIPPESRARIFDPGFTTKGVKVGMGLGLAIVHGIIEEHQGTIEVESEVGRGSTFRVSLPIRLVPKEVLPVADGH